MVNIILGSARSDEKGQYSGGVRGDQKQTAAPDTKGEVSMQPFYVNKKGWIVIRFKNVMQAYKFAEALKKACNNIWIGYSQSDRYSILKVSLDTTTPVNCDCSSLIRKCFIEATGVDPGDFNTSNEVKVLEKTGLVISFPYVNGTVLCTGDILVTKTKGHTVGVVEGNKRYQESTPAEPTPSAKAPTYQIGKGYVLKRTMNVRNMPSTDGSILGSLPAGTWVECRGTVKDGYRLWMKIPPDPSGTKPNQYICAYNGNRIYIEEG